MIHQYLQELKSQIFRNEIFLRRICQIKLNSKKCSLIQFKNGVECKKCKKILLQNKILQRKFNNLTRKYYEFIKKRSKY